MERYSSWLFSRQSSIKNEDKLLEFLDQRIEHIATIPKATRWEL